MRRMSAAFLIAFLVVLTLACSSGPNVLFTLSGEPVTAEQLRTEFRAAFAEGQDVFHAGCSAVNLEDDRGVIEFVTALVSGTIGDGIDPESLNLDRLYDILRSECGAFEE